MIKVANMPFSLSISRWALKWPTFSYRRTCKGVIALLSC